MFRLEEVGDVFGLLLGLGGAHSSCIAEDFTDGRCAHAVDDQITKVVFLLTKGLGEIEDDSQLLEAQLVAFFERREEAEVFHGDGGIQLVVAMGTLDVELQEVLELQRLQLAVKAVVDRLDLEMLFQHHDGVGDLAENLGFQVGSIGLVEELAALDFEDGDDDFTFLDIEADQQVVGAFLIIIVGLKEEILVEVDGNDEGLVEQAFLLEHSLGERGTQNLKGLVGCGVGLHDDGAADGTDIFKEILEQLLVFDVDAKLLEAGSHHAFHLAGGAGGEEGRDACRGVVARRIVEEVRHFFASHTRQVVELGTHILIEGDDPVGHIVDEGEEHGIALFQTQGGGGYGFLLCGGHDLGRHALQVGEHASADLGEAGDGLQQVLFGIIAVPDMGLAIGGLRDHVVAHQAVDIEGTAQLILTHQFGLYREGVDEE